jgi:regulation of enolase protein 1 (concanavalin A-like superfamily)
MERRGGEINCSYSSDGKTWIPVKQSALSFPQKVGIGVSASNVSPREFVAQFEDFRLESAARKTGE